ncbi:MAG: 4Fe-4S binding protein [Candidatus Aenigmatarchaeota archaeon]
MAIIMSVAVDKNKCISCGGCVSVCPVLALDMNNKFPFCDYKKCTNCNICIRFCPTGALKLE